MKKLVFFWLCLLVVYPTFGFDAKKVDRLEGQLSKLDNGSREYVDNLIDLSVEYWKVDPLQTRLLGQKIRSKSDSLSYSKGSAFGELAIALSIWKEEQYNEAMQGFLVADSLVKLTGDSADYFRLKYIIGLAYRNEHIFDLANKNFIQVISYALRSENARLRADGCSGLAGSYIMNGRSERVKALVDTAVMEYRNLGDTYSLLQCDVLYQKLLVMEEQFEPARIGFERLRDKFKADGYRYDVPIILYELGKLNTKIGQEDIASEYFLQALDEASQLKMFDLAMEIHYNRYELENGRENYQAALEHYKSFVMIQGEKVQEQVINQTHELKMKYDKERAEQDVLLLSQEQKIQRTYIISLLIFISLISIATIIVVMILQNNRKKDKELSESKQALMQADIQNARLKERELKMELEKRDLKLTSYTMNFIQKGTLLKDLQKKITEIGEARNPEVAAGLREMKNILNRHLSTEKDWEDFNTHFQNVHPQFIFALKRKYPDISPSDFRLCTLLKLNLNSKQIADIMGISPESVKTARYRLRTKLGLPKEANLVAHLTYLEEEDLRS